MKRARHWAYCYRVNLGVNTSMHVESYHRTLKKVFFERKANSRMDRALKALQDFTKYEQFMRLQSLVLGETTTKLSIIRNRHRASRDMNQEISSSEHEEYSEHVFQSTSDSSIILHVVKLFKRSCVCRLKCSACDICMHTVSCDCTDFLIQANLCRHVHFVKRKVAGNPVPRIPFCPDSSQELTINEEEGERDSFTEDPMIHVLSLSSSQTSSSVEKELQGMKDDALSILSSVHSPQQIQAAKALLEKMRAVVETTGKGKTNITALPMKSKKVKQVLQPRNFFPSKKTKNASERRKK